MADTNAYYMNQIITILERELRNSFVKFGYGDSDMYKGLSVFANKTNTAIIIKVPSYEIYLEYGTKFIKSKRIISSAIRKARPAMDDVLTAMWDDFINRVGSNLFAG